MCCKTVQFLEIKSISLPTEEVDVDYNFYKVYQRYEQAEHDRLGLRLSRNNCSFFRLTKVVKSDHKTSKITGYAKLVILY